MIGAGTDDYISYSQKGSHQIVEGTLNAILELYPIFSRMRMLRQWGGIVDICPDASPILSKTTMSRDYTLIVDGELEVLKQHLVLAIYLLIL